MNILGAIESSDSREHIKSKVKPHLEKYTMENFKHVECNQVEEWSKDCQKALKETKDYLKQIIATAPIDSLLHRLK